MGANAYLIFDYVSPTNFKFAGLDAKINQMVVGQRDSTGWHVTRQAPVTGGVKSGKTYNLLLTVNGSTVTLVVDNTKLFTHTFAPRVVEGYAYGLNYGLVGMGSNNSRGTFDNVSVQVLPPQVTFDVTEDFAGPSRLAFHVVSGVWGVDVERYHGTAIGGPAESLIHLGVEHINFNSYLEINAKVSVTGRGGIIFDRYDDNFKFVAIDAVTKQLLIGHYTVKRGWAVDAAISRLVNVGQDYMLGVVLKGSTVSVTLDGQSLLSHAFNAATVDGKFGVITATGEASFDHVRVRTDDTVFSQLAPAAVAAVKSFDGTANPLDSSRDGVISSWDALLIINALNGVTGKLATDGLDVNHDGYVSALDALLVINELNAPAVHSPVAIAGRTAAAMVTETGLPIITADDSFPVSQVALQKRRSTTQRTQQKNEGEFAGMVCDRDQFESALSDIARDISTKWDGEVDGRDDLFGLLPEDETIV